MTRITFRDLVEQVRSADRPHGRPPMPMATLAKQAGISRGYWYLLLAGGRQPSTEVVERIASVLRVPERMVEHALGMPKVRRAKP